MGRPKVSLLSKGKIVTAALEMVDEDGTDRFSIHRLAKALGVLKPGRYRSIRQSPAPAATGSGTHS